MKIGNKLFYIAPFSTGVQGTTTRPTYDTAKITNIQRLKQANLSINGASAESEGDDKVITIEEFSTGKLACQFTELPLSTEAIFTGHVYSSGELLENTADIAPYCGVSYAKLMVGDDKVKYYECVYLPMVCATKGSDDSQSKGKSLNLGYIPQDFDVFECPSGEYRARAKKATITDAAAWCRTKLGAAS